jgi:hypothetical protein
MSEVVARAFVGEQCRDVVVGKIRVLKLINNIVGLVARGGDAEYGFF